MHTATVQSIKQGSARLALRSEVKWKTKATTFEFQVPLRTTLSNRLILGAVVLRTGAHRAVFFIRDEADTKSHVYRLCVRGWHKNHHSDKRVWLPGSHLHCWSYATGDHHAQDPLTPPWPREGWVEASKSPLAAADVEALLNDFCQMLGIDYDPTETWVDPPIPADELPATLPDGEEIP